MINSDKLAPIVEGYKEYFPEHWENEKYKWEAVKHFQDNWDIDASDFGAMLKASLAKANNLLTSRNCFPSRMIIKFAEQFPEDVKKMFMTLYDEREPLNERITAFKNNSEELRERFPREVKNHFQEINPISVYLWLRYPDKYYIYKYELFKKCADTLDDTYRPKGNGAVDNVIGGFKMYDEIREALRADDDIRTMLDSVLTDSCYADPELVTATIDFGFYLARFYIESQEKWFPPLEEYTPGVSVEDWLDLLNNKDVFDESSLIVIQRFYEIGGQATCSELAQKYGNTAMHYSGIVSGLAKRIHKKTDCPVIKNELSENSKWWPILFVGKDADKQQTGAYVWKLRDELKAALDIKLADNQTDDLITRCWFVGAYSDSDDTHQDEEFIEQGIWQNGYTDKFIDAVNSVKVGDKIAIKTSYTKKKGLPFDNRGETISVMKIKIVGTVTANHMDGRTLEVDWDMSFEPKEWYFYTFRNTITLPKEDDWRTKALIDFVFNDIPQDYDRFQKAQIASPGEDNFSEETIDDSDLDTEADRPIYTYEMIQAFHSTQRNIKWFKPIIDALDDLGGSAPRPIVHKRIVDMCNVKDSELAKKNKSGFSQILNDIDWARNYLTYEGILDKNAPSGIWSLSPLGKKIKMAQELVEKIIIKWIKIKTAERENKPIPIIDLTPFYELKIKSYSEKDFLSEVYMTKPQYNTLTALLKHKKNIILQGAPGVGKTFTAKRLAWSVMSEKDDSRIEFIQFHQNYSYEDFIMGYRPDGNSFTLSEGVFYRFCKKARNDPEREYFFIIDEINRGNLSKIFGELLMLIENDYRKDSVTLAYKDERFSVPENLYIIGMMNTADRSLAMIDYALRRRFSFFEMCPGFDSEGFKKYSDDLDNDLFNALIVQIKLLNNAIENDSSLGKGFCIGHSYFCNLTAGTCTADRLNAVVEYDIIPMLSEYWFDDKDKFDKWSADLRGIFNDGR